MNWYALILLVVGAVALLFVAPQDTLPSVVLAYLVIIGYLLSWMHRMGAMVLSIACALLLIAFTDTAVSIIVQDTGAVGFDRVMELGPAVIMFISLAVGYWCAWARQLMHLAVCMFLAVSSLVLGW